MPRNSALTIVENTVLGLVFTKGPCTTYQIMIELTSSTSTYYRSQASAAYPAVRKLVRIGFAEKSGTGKSSQVSITDAGRVVLATWVKQGSQADEIAHTRDLLRLRLYFAKTLDSEELMNLLGDSLDSLNKLETKCRRQIDEAEGAGDLAELLPGMGALYETEARIRWIEAAIKMLEGSVHAKA